MSSMRLLLIVLVFTLSSCASKKPVEFEESDSSGIAKTFNLDNERLEKFKVERVQGEDDERPAAEVEKVLKTEKAPTRPERQKQSRPPVVKPSADIIAAQIPDDQDIEQTKTGEAKKDESNEEDELSLSSTNEKEYPAEFHKYDQTSKKLWSTHKAVYYPNEEKVFSIRYLGITAAHIRMTSKPLAKIGGEQAFHYVAQLKSARFYERIYKMDDTVESFVGVDDFLPVRYTLVQRETGQNVDDLQIFDQEEKKTFFWYKRDRDGEIKKEEKEAFIPGYFQDTFSSIFFARGLPMVEGMKFEFPIVTRTKLWLLKMKIEAIDEIRVMGEFVKAYRIEAETRLPSELSKKPGRMTIWVSADERKRLLKFSASVKFGSIEGILEEYSAGQSAYQPQVAKGQQ